MSVHGAQLQYCPTCRQPWPRDAEHDLRGFGWLYPLPRGISSSNLDGIFHDGIDGRNRYLVFETKGYEEDLLPGQRWLLESLVLNRLPFTVVVLRGTLHSLEWALVRQWSRDGAHGLGPYQATTPEAIREAVAQWLEGAPRFDPVAAPPVQVLVSTEVLCGERDFDGDGCLKPAGHDFSHRTENYAWPKVAA